MTEIAEKLRVLRKAHKMTLKDVADRAGCTSAYISQLEKGHTNPSISTLKKIASVFNVKIVDFFLVNEEESEDVVVPIDRRVEMTFHRGHTVIQSLVRNAENKRMQAFYFTIKPGGGSNGEYTHEGEEFGLVLEGEMDLTVGEKAYHLRSGDSFYFSSSKPHCYHNRGEGPAVVVWVTSPPSF